MSEQEIRVPIGIPVATDAARAADSLRSMRDVISKSKESIKEAAAAMRDLRGKSDDVKGAKDQLKATIRQEEAAITAATLKLIKQGASYEDVAKKTKVAEQATGKLIDAKKKESAASTKGAEAATKSSDALNKAISAAGGPVASARDKLSNLNETLGGTEGGMAAVAGGAALAAAAVLAVGAAAISAAISLGKFIIVQGDAARMMQLTRKANLAGRDDWATNLRDQVDAIARDIPLAKDRINELGISLAQSRIGGQTMVDTMRAVAGASAAAGDALGNKLKGIVERGALSRRFQLSPQELLGMDLDFNDVAKAYAEGMHVSVEAARKALFEGRVKLSDGAAALKKAVESKFGGINADKLLGLDNQFRKFKEDLASLAKDVDLKPMLQGIKQLASNVDQSTVNGKALKGVFTTIGNAIGRAFGGSVPTMQDFIDKAVYGALKLENLWLRADVAFSKLTKGKKDLGSALGESITKGLGMSLSGDSSVMVLVDVWATKGPAAANACRELRDEIVNLQTSVKEAFTGSAWFKTAGKDIVDGIGEGIDSGATELVKKVGGLADQIKFAFTGALKIHSPSKVFEQYGKQTTAGYARGVEASAPDASKAAEAMAPMPGSSAGGKQGAPLSLTIQVVVQGGGGAGSVDQQLQDPQTLQGLQEAIVRGIRGAGVTVQ